MIDPPMRWERSRRSHAHFIANITAAGAVLTITILGALYVAGGMP